MWTRRTFLQRLSTLPLVGGAATARLAAAPQRPPPGDYFKELGVRPFINAAGTYTAMTASLMPPEVMTAINYASRHFVMLDELHDKDRRTHRDADPQRGRDGHVRRRIGAHAGHRRDPHRP